MNLLSFYRYIKNSVIIEVSSGFTERFINLCNQEHIHLWNTSYKNGTLVASLYSKDFHRMRQIRNKSGVKIKIIGKKGLFFDLKNHKNRRGLFYGVISAIIFMFIMNLFVWDIEISGTEKFSDEQVKSIIRTVGLKNGTFVPGFDEAKASREAVNLFDGKVLWLSINIKGSKANVELRDIDEKDNKQVENTPSNFIADFDGILLQALTHNGVQIAYTGQTVAKGDMLISGIEEYEDGSISYRAADGEFTALHSVDFKKDFSKALSYQHYEELYRYGVIEIFGIKIPLSFKAFSNKNNYNFYNRILTVADKNLPFAFYIVSVTENKEENPTEESLIYCIDAFSKNEYDSQKNTLILNSDYSIEISQYRYRISSSYNCIDFIGIKSDIMTGN